LHNCVFRHLVREAAGTRARTRSARFLKNAVDDERQQPAAVEYARQFGGPYPRSLPRTRPGGQGTSPKFVRRCAPTYVPIVATPAPCDGARYSITSMARSRIDGGTSRPSALAVLRFTIISNFVGSCTGRSPGFAPRRMRST